MANTSLRVVDAGSFSIVTGEGAEFVIIDPDDLGISEETSFIVVLVDPIMTIGVCAYSPLADSGVLGTPTGLYIPPGQSMQLGPFRKEEYPKFAGFVDGAIFVTILPVYCER